ncbi:hypothetical protein PZ938_00560 [Luteipulveratus sp. YIM 133132]|uniref:hypothetical protein n=1 Tax=Luteipulveratus flavus TaxID=3031728 RepID=UPI0023B1CA48|nr:hypothetical protein [Luteipulveratus sp. YIM 133132]MDE9364085.1 hypothetical protein [Luteipulveratus sp. YIM 133132]
MYRTGDSDGERQPGESTVALEPFWFPWPRGPGGQCGPRLVRVGLGQLQVRVHVGVRVGVSFGLGGLEVVTGGGVEVVRVRLVDDFVVVGASTGSADPISGSSGGVSVAVQSGAGEDGAGVDAPVTGGVEEADGATSARVGFGRDGS